MALTTEQIKGRIKNYAKQNNADPRVVLRMYMMERFLERVAISTYADNFIILYIIQKTKVNRRCYGT